MRAAAPWRRGLYFVTPDRTDTAALLLLAEQALAGGASLLQYRNKSVDGTTRHAQASALQALGLRAQVPLIINDDVRLAAAVGAAGVHLGQDDGDIAAARAMLGPDAIIGASCYASMDAARRAASGGASYVAFGSVFPSGTKPGAARAPLELFRQAGDLGVPRVAIGGINIDNAGLIIAAAADLIAVLSAVADAPDPRAMAARLSALFDPKGPIA